MQKEKGNTRLIVSFIIVIIFIGLVIYTLSLPKPESNIQNVGDEQSSLLNNSMEQNSNDNNQVAKVGDVLVVNYTGRLEDGTAFDSNVDPSFNHVEPFSFTLGVGQVIPGWDEGLVGMKVGEKRTLTIPPEKAYGAQQVGPIPANSTLIFEVELVEIVR